MSQTIITCDGREYAVVDLTIPIDTASEFYRLAERYAARYNTTTAIALRIGLEVGVVPHGEKLLRALLGESNP